MWSYCKHVTYMTFTELSDETDLGKCLTSSSPEVIMTIDYNTDVNNA